MRIFVNEFCGHPFGMDLSRELARRGHATSHVYFADNTSTPKGSDASGSEIPGLSIRGLHIRRRFSKHGLLTRRAADLEYGQAVAAEVRTFRPDVVISANMPLDGQRIVQTAAHACGAKFVFWLQDIYSTAVRFVLDRKAPLLSGLIARYYQQVEKKLLLQSDSIVCIAPAFADYLSQWNIHGPDVTVIPNWAPLREIVPTTRDNPWSRENSVAGRFCFMYSGTLGMKHRPELLLELAKHLQNRGDACLVVNAGGAGADWLREHASEVSPDVLKLLPFQPYERISEVLASADVMIALLDSKAGNFAVPSKTLAYLCAARPLIIASPPANEAARVVVRADAGFVISPDRPEQMTAAAETLLSDPGMCRRLGANARAYAEQNFAIEGIADRFLAVFAGHVAATVPAGEPAICE